MKFLLVFVFCICCTFLKSQVNFSGVVVDSLDKPISNVNILLKNEKEEIITYTKTNSNGFFIFENVKEIVNRKIIFTHLNFETKSFDIDKIVNRDNNRFTLQVRITKLPEVTVKTNNNPITQSKDTISYSAKNFQNAKDRVLKDVLEKLPGITVTTTGQILYQNKAINRFYIEGNDILDDRYNLATNNLPLDAIDKIQVLENHQPIKMLDSIVFSERAALNIKLNRNSKVKLIGRGISTIGYNPNLLNDNQITLFSFRGKVKFINTLKKNNVGTILNDEVVALNSNFNKDILFSNSIKHDFVDFVNINLPSIRKNRYVNNNDFLQSNNLLVNLKKEKQLKISTTYSYSHNQIRITNNTTYYFPSDTFSLLEEINNLKKGDNINALFTLTKNTKKTYYNNVTSLKFFNERGESIISGNEKVNQILKSPFFNLNNNYSLLKKIGKKYLSLSSFTSFTNSKQYLKITNGVFEKIINNDNPYESTTQNFQLQNIYTNNTIGTSFNVRKLNIASKIGLLFEKQKIITNLDKIINTTIFSLNYPFDNSLNWMRFSPSFVNTLNINKPKFNINIGSGVSAFIAKYDTINPFNKAAFNKLLLDEYISFHYKLNNYFSSNISISYNNSVGNILDIRNGYFLENYRTLSRTGNTPLLEITNLNYAASFNYRNVLRSLFINSNFSYIITNSNLLFNSTFEAGSIINVSNIFNNDRITRLVNLNFSKYYSKIKSSISGGINYQKMNFLVLQQNDSRPYTSVSLSMSSKIHTDFSKSVFMDYSFEVMNNSNFIKKFSIKGQNKLFSFTQLLKLDKNINNFLFGFNFEHYFNNYPSNLSTYFIDINCSKQLKKKPVDLTFSVLNLFNNKFFVTNIFSQNNIFSSKFYLRPFSILAGVKYSF